MHRTPFGDDDFAFGFDFDFDFDFDRDFDSILNFVFDFGFDFGLDFAPFQFEIMVRRGHGPTTSTRWVV